MFVKNCVLEGGVQQVETPPIERSFSLASPSRTDEARKHARGKLRFHALPYDLEAFFGIDSIFGIQSILGAPVLVLPARGSNHPGKRSSPQAQKRA